MLFRILCLHCFAVSTLSMNSASLFARVGVFVFCCGISGIYTDSTLRWLCEKMNPAMYTMKLGVNCGYDFDFTFLTSTSLRCALSHSCTTRRITEL